jgi:hypothetical protein
VRRLLQPGAQLDQGVGHAPQGSGGACAVRTEP